MQPNEHNKLALEWKLILYNERMYDKVGRSSIAIHLNRSGYHPKERDNVMVDLFPIKKYIFIINYQINNS